MKTKIVFTIMLLMLVAFVSVVSAQGNDYSITTEKALEHANANMISFITGKAPGFENWKGASIDSKSQELYDINGQKLFYRFSVYKTKKLIGTIDVCADKTLGPSIYDIVFDPTPFKAAEATKKSKEIAKKNYPAGQVKSTNMVVYSYPRVGAMTVVKDKTTGIEHRIFVDGYTLDEVQDKPATEKELGVWSMYDQILKSGKENNLQEWQKSDERAKYIEKAAANKGVNINTAVTEENIKQLSGNALVLSSFTGKILSINGIGQERSVFCGPACIQMVSKYYNKKVYTQDAIYRGDGLWSWYPSNPPAYTSGLAATDIQKWASNRWGKTGTIPSRLFNSDAVSEIENNRPFFSMIPGHFRLCRGYITQDGYTYLRLNDPLPVGSTYGNPGLLERTYGSSESTRIYIR